MAQESQKTTGSQFFRTRLGIIAATVGSAVGLGNIWRFPYETGTNGGAAFIFIYLFFVIAIGIPVICAEFVIGRSTRRNIAGAFRELHAGFPWNLPAFTGVVTSFLIMGFYSVVAGWTLYYIYESFSGFGGIAETADLHAEFDSFTRSAWKSTLCTVLFLICNFLVISRGIRNGIEKMSNILMPLLVLILLAFCINSLFLPGAGEGLSFLFHPDFGALTPSVVLSAMGQAFFSLSVGIGTLATYASYFNDRIPLVKTASVTAMSDTLVAILAGIMIFPAVFSFGLTPEAGPRLVFEVLPSIFMKIPFGAFWSILFFILLFMASLTSTISMSEVSASYLIQEWKMSRKKAVMVNGAIVVVLAVICSLSFGVLSGIKVGGMIAFNLFDFVVSNVMMPLGGMFISAFVGWRLEKRIVVSQLTSGEDAPAKPTWYIPLIIFSLKYVTPVCIFLVFIFGLF